MSNAPRRLAEIRALPARRVAGLMTGTSMDGLDIALCRIAAGDPRRIELLESASEPMPPAIRELLGRGLAMTVVEAARLNQMLGAWYAAALAAFAERSNEPIDLVGVHGQTVYHEHGVTTLQLGEAGWIAQRLGCPVVADFRPNDIAVGGCGAPLVSAMDRWLLSLPDAPALAINLGGIANLTWLPPAGADDRAVRGFDCGPANMVLDELARRFTGGTAAYDHGGRFAARGSVRQEWLDRLLGHPFFTQPPPRSCGREQFGAHFVDDLLTHAAPGDDADWHDLFATASMLTVEAIRRAVEVHVPADPRPGRAVVSGGGARNPVLLDGLARALAPVPVMLTDAVGIPLHLKEAMAFALLASARIDEIPANMPGVTGARGPVLLGKIVEI